MIAWEAYRASEEAAIPTNGHGRSKVSEPMQGRSIIDTRTLFARVGSVSAGFAAAPTVTIHTDYTPRNAATNNDHNG